LQALSILFGAAFTAVVSTASGALLLGPAASGLGLRFVAGAAVLSLLVFSLCAAGLAYPVAFAILGAAVLAAWRLYPAGRSKAQPVPTNPEPVQGKVFQYIIFVLFAAFFVLYFFNALAPESSPDGSGYHLGLVGCYLREHGFHRITDDMYASLSQGVELLYLFGFAFGKHSAAALLHLAFLLALVGQMAAYARRSGFAHAGLGAALLVFSSPLVGIDGTSAYNDVALAAIAFTLFHLLELWDAGRAPRLLIAIGLLAGFAYAAKYTAWLATPYAIGWVFFRSRQGPSGRAWKNAAMVAACASFAILPWMLKNWIWVHNPVAPFFNSWFPNPYVTIEFENGYRKSMALYDLASRWRIPLEATTRGGLAGVLGPVFLLAPLALLSLRRREGRRLLLAALVFGANYFTNIGARFLISPLPFVALAMVLALGRARALAAAVVVVHAVISWPALVPAYSRPEAWRIAGIPWRAALRLESQDAYLEAHLTHYGAARMIDRVTEPGASVLTFAGIPEAYTSRRVLTVYRSAENQMRGAILWTGIVPEAAPTWRLRFPFPRQALRAIRVLQTNTGSDLWSIHELRVYDGAVELPREPAWRLTAHPNPWGIEDAFDNSLATFWICGEALRPGQFVRVDFGGMKQADSVLIEAAPNQFGVRLKLDGLNASGRWTELADSPLASRTARPVALRRALADELKRRGVDYLLAFDGEYGAGDLQRNAGLWGIRQVEEYRGARLYRLP
jgi:hypothetical protein